MKRVMNLGAHHRRMKNKWQPGSDKKGKKIDKESKIYTQNTKIGLSQIENKRKKSEKQTI